MLELMTESVLFTKETISITVLLLSVTLLVNHFFPSLGKRTQVSKIPGPPGRSLLFGDYHEYRTGPVGVLPLKMHEDYGDVVRFKGFLGQDYLQLTDPKALTHVLQNACYTWEKSEPNRERLIRLTGKSVVFVNGADHKRQRRILNPAFVGAQINLQTPIMFEYARQLKARWTKRLTAEKALKTGATFNILNEWSKAAIDIIGKAAFNFEFKTLQDDQNELAVAFEGAVAKTFASAPLWVLALNELATFLPLWAYELQNYVPSERFQALKRTMKLMRKASRQIVEQAERAGERGEEGKDSLSLLLKSNGEEAVEGRRLTTAEMTSEMTGLILGGHETTANTLSWLTWTLSLQQDIQDKLRAECQQAFEEAGEDELSAEVIGALPYLDLVTKETLRFHPVVERVERASTADDIVPLTTPVTLTDGTKIDHIITKKGQRVFMSINVLNWSKEIWGEDADEFKPERWEQGAGGFRVPTVYNNLTSFGAGARACIGFRMAILEMKVLICSTIASFTFLPRNGPPIDVKKVSSNFMVPVLRGEEELGPQMPIKIVAV